MLLEVSRRKTWTQSTMLVVRVCHRWLKYFLTEIFNLLSPDECDHLMKLGDDQGLHRSLTVASVFNVRYGLYAEDGVTLVYNEAEWNQTFNTFDLNEDGTIDYKELHKCLPVLKDRDVELTLTQVIR